MKVGMIGLGAMGLGMARNFARNAYLQAVYNRTYSKAEQLATELGVNACQRIDDLAAQVDIIVLCVSADADVLDLTSQLATCLPSGTVVIDTSTVSSDTAQQAAHQLKACGIDFLDAPVSGGVEGARLGALAMMVGGDEHVMQRVQGVLESIASRIIYMGETGAGQATKAANQIMAAGINQAVTDALAFAQRQALDLSKVIEVIAGGAAGNWFLNHRGASMARNSYAPGFKLALHHKDLKICQAMASAMAMPLPIIDMTVEDYEQLMADGFGDEDISALYRLKKPRKSLQ